MGTLFSPLADLNPLESWAIDPHYRREEEEGLALVRQAMNDLLPSIELEGIDKEQGQLIFRTPDGPVPLDRLSDGYQNVAAWCGDLLFTITQTFKYLDRPLATRGLLLIDEVDLHLHPVWQRQLRRFLDEKFPGLQVVATTHSPLTAHQAGEGELFYLQRTTEHMAPALQQYEGTPRNLMIHQLLMSPIFGLTTMDSADVENLRREHRELADQSVPLQESDKRRVEQIEAELSGLPDFYAETDPGRRQSDLLAKIEQSLRAQ